MFLKYTANFLTENQCVIDGGTDKYKKVKLFKCKYACVTDSMISKLTDIETKTTPHKPI